VISYGRPADACFAVGEHLNIVHYADRAACRLPNRSARATRELPARLGTWITSGLPTILELPRGGLIEMLDVATSSLLYSQ
jgi:hypothetical protein